MVTECNATQLEFQGVDRRPVVATFDGGHLSSDGGALLLGELDRRLGVTSRLAECFSDFRDADLIEHSVLELVRQRLYGLALGYEDLNDHDDLLRDPLLALVLGKKDPLGRMRRRASDQGKALASSSTLNRFELTPADANTSHRYKKIVYHPERIQALLVDLFLESFECAPKEIILDFDATDDPVHGNQEGKFFHGYYRCYCYLPLYVTCGDHVLAARRLRTHAWPRPLAERCGLSYSRWAPSSPSPRADSSSAFQAPAPTKTSSATPGKPSNSTPCARRRPPRTPEERKLRQQRYEGQGNRAQTDRKSPPEASKEPK